MKNNEAKIITEDEKITTTLGYTKVVVAKDTIKLKINDTEKLKIREDLLKSSKISHINNGDIL